MIRAVENAIHVQARVHGGDKDALHREFRERLDDPALEFEFHDRDIDQVIQEICQDLGIAHQGRAYIYQRRTPQDVQDLRARAAAPPRSIPPPPPH